MGGVAAEATMVDVDTPAALGANTGSPTSNAAGCKTPWGVDEAPVGETPT